MTILIANIGTSDLAVKIDNYYFPVRFDRNEPNIDYSNLTEEEKSAWEQRESFINEVLCPDLDVKVEKNKFSFRELTFKLLKAYEQNEEIWHERIRPGRIWGVVQTARSPKFRVKEAYIFVTDQPETEEMGYPSDTIHLFDILKNWFKREIPNLNFNKEEIPQNILPINTDGLLNYYYQFFGKEIIKNETILISIKAGTHQMQNALKIQAIASGIPKQLFIEPHLSIKKVLAGEASDCTLTSYWRYMRNQKYQSVKLLLENRFDFDGAKQILQDWNKVLKFLITEKVTDEVSVAQSNQTLEQVIQALDLGVNLMNLDDDSARQILQKTPQIIGISKGFDDLNNSQGDEKLLNLYTQCRIYWKLDQIANFLARMSSFYEETLHRLIIVMQGEKYFQGDWYLNTELVRQEMNQTLWQHFVQAESQFNLRFKNHDFRREPLFKLDNRFSKRNFLEKLLVPYRQIPAQQWQVILNSLKSLDFWAKQRNQLIHSASGISQVRMKDLLNEYKTQTRENVTCEPAQIRNVMAAICASELGVVRLEYRQNFINKKNDFYLYSSLINWVVKQLQAESNN